MREIQLHRETFLRCFACGQVSSVNTQGKWIRYICNTWAYVLTECFAAHQASSVEYRNRSYTARYVAPPSKRATQVLQVSTQFQVAVVTRSETHKRVQDSQYKKCLHNTYGLAWSHILEGRLAGRKWNRQNTIQVSGSCTNPITKYNQGAFSLS